MQKALLIAEKPDLMRQIEASYRTHRAQIPYEVTFTSQRGHLVALKEPDELNPDLKTWSWDTLPINPERYGGWQYKLIKEKKKGPYLTAQERYRMIADELKSGRYDFVIHAGDPDQEGELLVRLVLRYAKNRLPVKRFWSNDLTDGAVFDALTHLRDDDHDPMLLHLADAAYAREWSDWLMGMNLSRAATLRMGTTVNVGRVMTQLLATVCRREDEIRNFRPVTRYGVRASYTRGFDGTLFDAKHAQTEDTEAGDDQKASGTVWFPDRADAEAVIRGLGNTGTVTMYDKHPVSTRPPKLYKLATAQIDAGAMGYSDSETLAAIQSLYEKKYMTYPRTDCEYMSSHEDFAAILKAIRGVPGFAPFVDSVSAGAIDTVRKTSRWVNDKALKDEGHSALHPTGQAPDLAKLSPIERDIYVMIARRFLCVFLPPLKTERVSIIVDISGKTFRSSGRTLIDRGFTALTGAKTTDVLLPAVKQGEQLPVSGYTVTETTTTCPKRYTSPGLIAYCEDPRKYLCDQSLASLGKRLKIGTPATRSAIIEKLIRKRYIETVREKKTDYLKPTPVGEQIIRNLGASDICKVDMTAHWEEQLESVRDGSLSLKDLNASMWTDVVRLTEEFRTAPMQSIGNDGASDMPPCPVCGKPMHKWQWGWGCSGYRDGCRFGIRSTIAGKSLTDRQIRTLLTDGRIGPLSGFRSKKGTSFSASLVLKNGDVAFEFPEAKAPEDTPYLCPNCGKPLRKWAWGWGCSGYKDGCQFAVGSVISGRPITDQELETLLKDKKVGPLTGFRSKKTHRTFSASLVIGDHGKVGFDFS